MSSKRERSGGAAAAAAAGAGGSAVLESSKRLKTVAETRLDLQCALGLGDCFEDKTLPKAVLERRTADVELKEVEVKAAAGEEEALATVSLRIAQLASSLLKVAARDEQRAADSSFTDVLLRDLRVNPRLSQHKAYVELGLWHKVRSASSQCVRRCHAVLEEEARAEATASRKQKTFRDLYVGSIAEFFGDELEAMRAAQQQGDTPLSLAMTSKSLEAGMQLFSTEERQLLLQSLQSGSGVQKKKEGE